MIKAIKTFYKGVEYDSLLEVRVVKTIFDLGGDFDKEPQGFEIDGENYLPDGIIWRIKNTDVLGDHVFIEIKGAFNYYKKDEQKTLKLAKAEPMFIIDRNETFEFLLENIEYISSAPARGAKEIRPFYSYQLHSWVLPAVTKNGDFVLLTPNNVNDGIYDADMTSKVYETAKNFKPWLDEESKKEKAERDRRLQLEEKRKKEEKEREDRKAIIKKRLPETCWDWVDCVTWDYIPEKKYFDIAIFLSKKFKYIDYMTPLFCVGFETKFEYFIMKNFFKSYCCGKLYLSNNNKDAKNFYVAFYYRAFLPVTYRKLLIEKLHKYKFFSFQRFFYKKMENELGFKQKFASYEAWAILRGLGFETIAKTKIYLENDCIFLLIPPFYEKKFLCLCKRSSQNATN